MATSATALDGSLDERILDGGEAAESARPEEVKSLVDKTAEWVGNTILKPAGIGILVGAVAAGVAAVLGAPAALAIGLGVGFIRLAWKRKEIIEAIKNKPAETVVKIIVGVVAAVLTGGAVSDVLAGVGGGSASAAAQAAPVTPAQFNPNIDVHAAGDGTGANGGEAQVVETSAEGDQSPEGEASLTLREQAIQLALEDVPAAEPYVDGNGDFSLRDAVVEGGMTPEAARSLRADWSEAYAEASRKVLHA